MTTLTENRSSSGLRYLRDAFDERLASEDAAEDDLRLPPDDRVTCPLHRRWIYRCVASPAQSRHLETASTQAGVNPAVQCATGFRSVSI